MLNLESHNFKHVYTHRCVAILSLHATPPLIQERERIGGEQTVLGIIFYFHMSVSRL